MYWRLRGMADALTDMAADPDLAWTMFGREITFMGGVDTQELLPHGTAAEVYRATVRLIEGMTADGGGYILAASHTIPPETPDANIFAMYAAAGVSREEIFDRAAELRRRGRQVRPAASLFEIRRRHSFLRN